MRSTGCCKVTTTHCGWRDSGHAVPYGSPLPATVWPPTVRARGYAPYSCA
ncbi:hypothetical protein ACFPK5_40005 [Streptomyces beijiangensis]